MDRVRVTTTEITLLVMAITWDSVSVRAVMALSRTVRRWLLRPVKSKASWSK
mgnify:CR=1 FL=1